MSYPAEELAAAMAHTNGGDPFRQVVGHQRLYVKWEWCFGHRSASSVLLQLECGHEKSQKGSVAIPGRARCRECGRGEKSHGTRRHSKARLI